MFVIKLKINERVFRILIIDTVCKLVLTTTASIAFFIAYISGKRTVETCGIYLFMLVLAYTASVVFPAVTSVIRLHLATRMANQQHFQEGYMNAVIAGAVLCFASLCIGSLIATVIFKIPMSPPIIQCMNPCQPVKLKLQHTIAPMIFGAVGMSGLMTGIVFDIGMFRFLKKRQDLVHPQVAMVAWAPQQPPLVSPGQEKDYSNRTVPIQATCLGLVCLLVQICIGYLVTFHLGSIILAKSVFQNPLNIFVAIHMPLVLLLTVKSNIKKKPKQQHVIPPIGLQFHD